MMIDHTFEVFVTDNPVTQKLFNEMTSLSMCLNPRLVAEIPVHADGFRPHAKELTALELIKG